MSRVLRFTPAVVLSLLIAATAVVNLRLALAEPLNRELMVMTVALEALVLAGAVWIYAAVLEQRVFRPLRQLRDHLGVFLHSDTDHRLDIAPGHHLGEVPGYVAELGRQLSRERLESARAMEAAAERVDHRKSRLEAILRDLHEGVIVCNEDHRIVLFNQSAAAFFGEAGHIGLHRPVTSLLTGGRASEEFAVLKKRYREQRDRTLLSRFEDHAGDGRAIDVRMSLIVDQEGECSGYVLTLPGLDTDQESSRVRPPGVLTERPEFYDFSLFEARHDAADLAGRLDELDYVVFDTETTGLNPSKGDGIVQISGVRLVKGGLTGEEFDSLVNPGIPIPPASIRFHGITDDMVDGAPAVAEALRSFREFAEGAVLVAHNAAFDMKFLKLREDATGAVFDNPVLDTLLVSYILQPDHGVHTLDAIAARFGVSIADDVRHTALGDARATAEIFVKMLPVLQRRGLETLGQVIEASDRVLHIRREQDKF